MSRPVQNQILSCRIGPPRVAAGFVWRDCCKCCVAV
jgi:hypothetical protein